MHRYFTRLAQRTGLEPPVIPAPTQAGASVAGVVERDVYVEAPPLARTSNSGVPQSSAAPEAAPRKTRSSPSSHRGASEEAVTENTAGPGHPAALAAPLATMISPIEPVSPFPSSASAPPPAPSKGAAEFASHATTRSRAPDTAARGRPNTATPRAGVEVPGARSAFADAPHTPPRLMASPPSPSASGPDALDPLPGAKPAGPKEKTSAPSVFQPPVAFPYAAAPSRPAPASNEVEVRIGAIRVEVHPPLPPTSPMPPARHEAARERPSFQPRRHYLRW